MRATIGLGLVALLASCGSAEEIKLCGQIPDGGCPIGRGGTCEDAACRALYDCAEGAWVEVQVCPGAVGGAGGAGGGGEGGTGPCERFVVDRADEASGCEPDLQHPDCPAAAAETCVESACLTECADFFLCKREGWSLVAFCDTEGNLVASSPR